MRKALLMTTAAVGLAMLPLAGAKAQSPMNWAGLYAGVHGGYLTGDVELNYEGMLGGGGISGFVVGGLAGYNFAMTPAPNAVFGIEADFGLASVDGVGIVICDLVETYSYDMEWDAHFRVRVGVPHGHVMPFLAGGLAVARFGLSEFDEMLYEGTFVGGTIGAGIDAMFGPHFIARAEVLYDWYPEKTVEYTNTDWGAIHPTATTVRVAAIWKLP